VYFRALTKFKASVTAIFPAVPIHTKHKWPSKGMEKKC